MTATIPPSTTLLDLLLQGGWAMYPLGLFCMVMLYLIIHCLLQTRRKACVDETLSDRISEQLKQDRLDDATESWQQLNPHQKIVSESLWQKLTETSAPEEREQLEALAYEGVDKWEAGVSQWIQYLNVIAATAPMVGLLGTVSGMISAFQTIATGGMGKPELLAGDIGEALITTATGLTIGIPAMIAYFFLKNRLNQRIQDYVDLLRGWIDVRCKTSIN